MAASQAKEDRVMVDCRACRSIFACLAVALVVAVPAIAARGPVAEPRRRRCQPRLDAERESWVDEADGVRPRWAAHRAVVRRLGVAEPQPLRQGRAAAARRSVPVGVARGREHPRQAADRGRRRPGPGASGRRAVRHLRHRQRRLRRRRGAARALPARAGQGPHQRRRTRSSPTTSSSRAAAASASTASTTRASASTPSGSRRTTSASSSRTPRSARSRPTTGS